jgi:hypothetical protein
MIAAALIIISFIAYILFAMPPRGKAHTKVGYLIHNFSKRSRQEERVKQCGGSETIRSKYPKETDLS